MLSDAYASRQHAEVRWDGAKYVLHDLGSHNGTFLNGRRLEEPRPLTNGDRITLGDLALAFHSNDETLSRVRVATPVGPGIRVDTTTAEVWVEGKKISVTAKEFLAIALLALQGGALVSKDKLAEHVWPEYQGAVSDYNLEQLVSRLRRKIETDPAHPRYLITVRGLGYRLTTA